MLNESSRLVYGDELITATELNQQPGRVLDLAMEHPVTITRNDQHFALLRREEMALWVKAATVSLTVFEVMAAAYRLRLGEPISLEHPYGWLTVFDSDELCELIAELEKAYRLAESEPGAWSAIEIVIHEWHESAIALSSPELAAAFSDEISEFDRPPNIANMKINDKLKTILTELRSHFELLYGDRLTQMVLYGSQARGDADPDSDIDVLVVLKAPVQVGEEIDRTIPIVADLSLANDVVISCNFMNEERFTNYQGPLLRNIRREGILI